MGRPVIFVIPHPDDETLAAGVSIAEHVVAGRDVHILLLTRGLASGVLGQLNGTTSSAWWGMTHNPSAEGYAPLSEAEFGAARVQELTAALGALGVGPDRIHEAGLPDGQVQVADVKSAITALALSLPTTEGYAGLWAPSWVVDDHPDHRAAGQAVHDLGQQDPVRYWDRRYFVLPAYWSDSRLNQVPGEFYDTPTDTTIKNRAINACRSYGAWAPGGGAYAIGHHSVSAWFGTVMSAPKCLIHKD